MISTRALLWLFALAGALPAAACAQYLDRKETAAFSAGNAVQTNVATHVIDPWPLHAWNTRIAFDGERAQRSMERFRTNRVTDPSCAMPDERGRYPDRAGNTNCAEAPPTPVLPRRGGTEAPRAAAGAAAR